MARTKPADERRADLLQSARSLFVAKGLAATTMEDITNGAGVSKGLFYLYFRSKDDVVVALQNDFSRTFAARVRDAASSKSDWGEKLDACVQESFACYRDLHDLHEVLFHHASGKQLVNKEHEAAHNLLVEALQEVLDGGVAAGEFHVADTATTAKLFYVMMNAFDPSIFGNDPPTEEHLLRASKEMYRRTAGVGEKSWCPDAR